MNTRNQYLLMLAIVVIMGIGGYFMYQQDKANPAEDTSQALEFKAEDVDDCLWVSVSAL